MWRTLYRLIVTRHDASGAPCLQDETAAWAGEGLSRGYAHGGNVWPHHQVKEQVAELKTRSLPFSVIMPLLRRHFHLLLVCETCATPRKSAQGGTTRGARLLELRQHQVIRLRLVLILL